MGEIFKKPLIWLVLAAVILVLGIGLFFAMRPKSDHAETAKETVSDEETEATDIEEDDMNGEIIVKEPAKPEDPEHIAGSLKRVSVHDPSIIADRDSEGKVTYYVFGSHIAAARSADLANWKEFSNGYAVKNNVLYGELPENLAEAFKWAGENDSDCKGGFAVWAPHVIYNERYVNEDGSLGAYMCYFCTSSTYCRSVIGYAVSDRPDGGFICKGTLVYSGFTEFSAYDENSEKDKIWTNTNIDELIAAGRIEEGYNYVEWGTGTSYNTVYGPNAIDPAILFDRDGRMWMAYGSWSGGIYMLELDPATGDAIYPGKNGTTEDGRVIDKYFGVRIAGGRTKSGEGPFIVYDPDTEFYYLYTTYGKLNASGGYNMRLFRSQNPTGPYVDAAGRSAVFGSDLKNMLEIGIKVMGNYRFSSMRTGYRSPGHCSSFIDDDGQMYLIYHTRFETGGEMHQVRVHRQFVNEKGWPVTAVFENRGEKIEKNGYAKEFIVGDYEFINHGTESDFSSVKEPVMITLNEDGTVTGEVSGNWSEKEGTCYATLELDGVEYNGVFYLQHDESAAHKTVMTFTAIGNNNMTVWGVKTFE